MPDHVYVQVLDRLVAYLLISCLAVYGVLSYVIVWANRLWLLLFDRCQVGCDTRCSCRRSSNSGLYSFEICSGISSLFLCSICMYICSVGSNSDCLLTPLRSVMVSIMFPYSCLLLRMCSTYEDRGSLFLMYLVCSWCLVFRLRFVCPTYALWHDLHMILYMPLLSWSGVRGCCLCLVSCRNVDVVLNAMRKLVFLNMFVTALILGL